MGEQYSNYSVEQRYPPRSEVPQTRYGNAGEDSALDCQGCLHGCEQCEMRDPSKRMVERRRSNSPRKPRRRSSEERAGRRYRVESSEFSDREEWEVEEERPRRRK